MSMREKRQAAIETASATPRGLHPTWIHNSYDDNIWHIRVPEGSQTHRIDFASIPDDFRLNAKLFLWALEHETDTRYNQFRMTSGGLFAQFFYEYRSFTRYLTERGISQLHDAPRSLCLAHLKQRRDMKLSEGESLRPVRMCSAKCLQALYRLGPCGSGTLPDGLHNLVTAGDIDALLGAEVPGEETPILPDDIARALFNASVDAIEHAANLCLVIKQERAFRCSEDFPSSQWEATVQKARLRWLRRHGHIDQIRMALKAISPFHSLVFPSRRGGAARVRVASFDEDFAIMRLRPLEELIRHVSTAAFVIFAMLTGFRLGEILSLRRDGLRIVDDQLRIATRITKGTGWQHGVLTERPAPMILLSVQAALMQVADVFGDGDDRLWWNPSNRRIVRNALNENLNTFLVEVVGVTDHKITSRMFRRYFAIFYIRRFMGPDDALRHHFRHVSPLALRAYVSDRRGAQYLIEAKRELLREVIGSVQSGDGRFVSRGAIKEAVDYAITVLPESELWTSELQAVLQAGGGDVYPQAWGLCTLQRGGSLHAACGSRNGMPNAVEAYPENCSRCPHLVIGDTQRDFWKQNGDAYKNMLGVKTINEMLKRRIASTVTRIDTMLAAFKGCA